MSHDEPVQHTVSGLDICRVVEQVPGGGECSETSTLRSGLVVTHRFSFVVGLEWEYRRKCYQSTFGELPSWLTPLHPSHRSKLCKLAVESGLPLPVDSPESLPD